MTRNDNGLIVYEIGDVFISNRQCIREIGTVEKNDILVAVFIVDSGDTRQQLLLLHPLGITQSYCPCHEVENFWLTTISDMR